MIETRTYTVVFILSWLLLNAAAYASPNEIDFTDLKRTDQILEITDTPIDIPAPPTFAVESIPGLSIAQILLKAWDLVIENRPVGNMNLQHASALPEAAKARWTELTGWKSEKGVRIRTVYQNLFKQDVIVLEYLVKYVYGGSLRGHGRYLASARIVPTDVKVLWGYNLNVTVAVPAVFNMNTAEDPLAALQMDMVWTVSSLLKSDSKSSSYQFQGDGKLIDLKTEQVLVESALR